MENKSIPHSCTEDSSGSISICLQLGADARTGRASMGQERIWAHINSTDKHGMYNHVEVIELDRRVDMSQLAAATKNLMRDQLGMRIKFIEKGAQLFQVEHLKIDDPGVIVKRLSSPSYANRWVRAFCESAIKKPFDIANKPPIDLALVDLGIKKLLIVRVHHILFDAPSLGIVIRQLRELYEAGPSSWSCRKSAKKSDSIMEFAVEQRERLSINRITAQTAYWNSYLHGVSRAPMFHETGGHAKKSTAGIFLRRLRAEQLLALGNYAKRNRVSNFTLFLSMYILLLNEKTGVDDFVVGIPVSKRFSSRYWQTVGYLSNTIVVRAKIVAGMSFSDLLNTVRKDLIAGLDHSDLPFERIAKAAGGMRSEAALPLFNVMMTSGDYDDAESREYEEGWRRAPTVAASIKCDLSVLMWRDVDSVGFEWIYDKNKISRRRLEEWASAYESIGDRILMNSSAAVGYMSVEGRKVPFDKVYKQNKRTGDEQSFSTALSAFEHQVLKTPGAIAVRKSQESLTYRDLDVRSNQCASYLIEIGINREEIVAILMPVSWQNIIAILAIWKCGAAYLPLDSKSNPDRIQRMAKAAGVKIVLGDDESSVESSWRFCRWISIEKLMRESRQFSEDRVIRDVDQRLLAYVIHTSGSTGQPKGVMIEHQSLANYIQGCAQTYRSPREAVVPLCLPMTFDASITSIFFPLASGRTIEYLQEEEVFDGPASILRDGGSIGLLKVTPSVLRAIGHKLSRGARGSIGALIVGGEPLDRKLAMDWLSRYPQVQLVNEYGPTEATVGCCVFEVGISQFDGASVPIGQAMEGAKLYVLNAEDLQPVALGLTGELFIGGLGLARGYLGLPGETAARFIADPFGGRGTRMYRTGDHVRLSRNGQLEFLGRMDGQVKLHGRRVELEEVRQTMLTLRDLSQVSVVARQSGGETVAVAFVVLAAASQRSADDIKNEVATLLPWFMVPRVVVLVSELPVTRNGKVDESVLKDTPLPIPNRLSEVSRTEIEVAKVILDVLALDRLNFFQPFFEMGGDSVSALRVVIALKNIGLKLTVRDFLTHQTVSKVAQLLGSRRGMVSDSGLN